MVKNPPFNAGDGGSIPDQGTMIPRAAGQLSPCATSTEAGGLPPLKPARSRAHALQREACTLQLGSGPHMLHLEDACMRQWRLRPQLFFNLNKTIKESREF